MLFSGDSVNYSCLFIFLGGGGGGREGGVGGCLVVVAMFLIFVR